MEKNLDEDFKKIGLKLVTVIVENLSVPEEVEKMMDTRTQMGIMGDKMQTYMQFQAANAMTEAAKNPSGGLASAGVGVGAGLGLGQMFADTIKGGMTESKGGTTCAECGAAIGKGVKFCPGCGKPAAGGIQCPKCKATVPQGGKFCPECGSSLDLRCPDCNFKLEASARFCPNCGKKL